MGGGGKVLAKLICNDEKKFNKTAPPLVRDGYKDAKQVGKSRECSCCHFARKLVFSKRQVTTSKSLGQCVKVACREWALSRGYTYSHQSQSHSKSTRKSMLSNSTDKLTSSQKPFETTGALCVCLRFCVNLMSCRQVVSVCTVLPTSQLMLDQSRLDERLCWSWGKFGI